MNPYVTGGTFWFFLMIPNKSTMPMIVALMNVLSLGAFFRFVFKSIKALTPRAYSLITVPFPNVNGYSRSPFTY